MSKLEDLEKELYSSDDQSLEKRVPRHIPLPESNKIPISWNKEPLESPKQIMNKKNIKLLLGLAAVVFIITSAVFVFLYLSTRGQEAQITIQGPDQAESGSVVSLPIGFKNTSATTLQNAEATIILPAGSRIIEDGLESSAPPRLVKKLGDIKPGQTAGLEISARLFGKEGEGKNIQAILVYQPQSLQASFSANTSKTITINHVSLAISWEGPNIVSQGQDVTVKIHYISDAQNTFDNLSLKIDYPAGLNIASQDPKPTTGDNVWKIGSLDPHKEGIITLQGKINGNPGDTKQIMASLGVLNEATNALEVYSQSNYDLQLAQSPLMVTAYVADGKRDYNISASDSLDFTLHYIWQADLFRTRRGRSGIFRRTPVKICWI